MLREKIANGHDGGFYWSDIYRAIRPVCEMVVLDLEIDSSIYRNHSGKIVRD